jgi:hypothetical protein
VRPDPFAGEWDTLDAWLAAQPERPALVGLPGRPQADPDRHADGPRPASAPLACDDRRPDDTPDDTPGRHSPLDPKGAVNERSITCAACGAATTILRGARGPVTAYCEVCRAERKRDQARQRMVMLRARRRRGEQARG